jgi:type 1 glutamine amidotransferase
VLRRELLSGAFASLLAKAPAPIVFVCGDHEYSGEQTLPLLAAVLEKDYKLPCRVIKSAPDQNGETNIPGIDALEQAPLAVFFLRWRRLPAEQLALIDRYVKSGKPLMGFRTSTHSFNFPKTDPLFPWNAWAAEAFGAPPGWGADGHTHYGHNSSTDVAIEPAAARHPILRGVAPAFHVRSWLYKVRPKWPAEGAEVLLQGTAINPSRPAEVNPVAWTWKNRHGGRVFFTTLGHPEDFSVEPFQRLVVNAVHWSLGRNSPRWKGALKINVPYRGIVKSPPPGA